MLNNSFFHKTIHDDACKKNVIVSIINQTNKVVPNILEYILKLVRSISLKYLKVK